ncbi:hypothetical protein FSARC_1958 [Fusarium sarcochroum]|uniref:Uncharacterized protein n=1 Tax=Fusarium sarcochroum TaxID=1208366 RepID=A0A8H4U7Q2_9HYPO|nr:hypothetical protein FSARC_1958 [Fusarium sarcochroum]
MATAQEAKEIVRGLTGKAAKRRYGGGPRFAFELLRNSEDKPFTKATAEGSPPFISFKIYPNRIIVDCNEDGLTKSDLEAICTVGKNTDSTNETGFRSVFTVASRVHIQSGNFSFELQHDNIDADAGMMRPVWITPAGALPSPLTRMTLYLHDQDDEEDTKQLKKIISTEFGDLLETSLLFLRKLQKIMVEFYDGNGMLDRSKQFCKQQIDEYRISLETTSIKAGAEMIQDQLYHVTNHQATGLNPGINNGSSTADVVLAFPLSSDYKPLVDHRKQQIFALSPIRTSDYTFHIHSDFDVNTSERDIITTSGRNLSIRLGIRDAIYRAILQLCEHPTLGYDWPLFLPSPGDSSDDFWSILNQSIKRVVEDNHILRSHKWNSLYRLSGLSYLPDFAKDKHGKPLLDGPLLDAAISPNYSATAISILENYGLKCATYSKFLSWLSYDLDSGYSSMCGKDKSTEWHTDMARTLLTINEAKHRSDVFLGLLHHLWVYEMMKVLKSPALITRIQNLPAKHLCGVNFATKLQDTWLPFKDLKCTVEQYMEHPGHFPFLIVEDGTAWNLFIKWNFLSEHFSVGKDNDLYFLLEILRGIKRSCPGPPSGRQSQKVLDLYVAISSKLDMSGNPESMQQKIRDVFDDAVILAPYEKEPMWTSLSSCLWAAPSDMVTADSLQVLYKKQNLSKEDLESIEILFRKTLGIRDATMNDLLGELDMLRGADREDLPRILDLYEYLDEKIAASADMRTAFEASPLIFVEQKGVSGWYTTSECLWSSTITVRGKVTLDETYSKLKDFFVNKLGVVSLTPRMVYDELRKSSPSNIKETKMALFASNEFLETAPIYLDPEPVRKAKVFPVRNPDGTSVLSSIDMDFAIGDRDNLRAKFEDKISLLDFELGDVCRLKPLIDWLRLQDRYLSRCVQEDTSISENVELPISSKKRDLKNKAYHIARVAATFNSPRILPNGTLLYDQLRTMRVIEVDQISSVLRISQNGQTFEAKIATASGHIAELDGKLTIYVPTERKAQEICFGSALPRKLATWLMQDLESRDDRNVDIEAVNALTSIFASERCVLDEILEDQGIIHVSFENEDEDETDSDEEDDEDVEDDEEFFNALETGDASSEQGNTPINSLKGDDLSPEPYRGHTETEIGGISWQNHATLQARPGSQNASPALSTHSTVSSLEGTEYRAILDRVIEAARRQNFPCSGTFDFQDLQSALPDVAVNEAQYESYNGLSTILATRSMEQWQRTRRIGAAGQLYVFELLSKLNLPRWNRQSWQSSIRTLTTIHPKYTDLPKSTHKVSDDDVFGDLNYVDIEGRLTEALIDAGLLIRNEWSEKRPKYHIFVWTTTGPRETPIFMKEYQYNEMQHMSFKNNHLEVCLIFRVYFLLDSGKINYSACLDLEQLKNKKILLLK